MPSVSHAEAIVILEGLQKEHQRNSLSSPKGKTAFDFGEAVGFNNGLAMAIQALTADEDTERQAERLAEESR